jgi:hypothetical protein
MSNLLRTMARESGMWKRTPGAAAASRSKSERLQIARARKKRKAAVRFAGVEVERPASLPLPGAPSILSKLRGLFAPRASSKGR